MTRLAALLASSAVVLGLAVGGYLALRAPADPLADCTRNSGAASGGAAIGGPFALAAPDGRRVTDVEAITRPTLVYFGYTYCPDFCPTDLARNAAAADLLAEKGIDVGEVFITIDPARDTPEAIGAYAAAIEPRILALSGTAEEVDVAAKAYKVYYAKAGDDPDAYLMDHSTFTYLMAPGAGFLEFYPSDMPAEELADSAACFASALPAAD